ncbi:lactonase family protein [Occallatibacter riparius]|uniref:Uncharacterized protein n=1 Tax=Occallatibacter riparius TaxID=1002689 RepID=A0A9J7BS05_9BACT|nr:hypothetical protein [Occallatibacter riparius]UWZ83829.1 hypothetical protein MOP44_25115 [Occallatibacter riparius]
MRIGSVALVLSSAVALSLLTSCSSVTLGSNQGGGSSPIPEKKTPVITWATPAAITNPAPLTSAQLNASADVAGTFAYSPAAGTVLSAGTQTISTIFTPTDAADYRTVTATVSLVVNPAPVDPGGGGSACNSGRSNGVASFVYVSTGDQQDTNYQIYGFAVGEDSSLTAVPGSQFATEGVAPLGTVGRGSNLFGADSYKIYSYAIHSDGCISEVSSLVAGQPAGTGIAGQPIYSGPTSLFFDPKYEDLYSSVFVPSEEGYYASFSFDGNTGQVAPINATATNPASEYPLTIASNDRYAVSATCYYRVGPQISEFKREDNGALKYVGSGLFPEPAVGSHYCPQGVAADRSNHIVIQVRPYTDCGGPFCDPSGPWQFAIYTVDDAGTLSTNSTWKNMANNGFPVTQNGVTFGFSPDGKYFEANDGAEIQLFAWDGENSVLTPMGKISGGSSCTSSDCSGPQFGSIAWDGERIYAVLGDRLLVYLLKPSGVESAPGSPYAVPHAASVSVVTPMAN